MKNQEIKNFFFFFNEMSGVRLWRSHTCEQASALHGNRSFGESWRLVKAGDVEGRGGWCAARLPSSQGTALSLRCRCCGAGGQRVSRNAGSGRAPCRCCSLGAGLRCPGWSRLRVNGAAAHYVRPVSLAGLSAGRPTFWGIPVLADGLRFNAAVTGASWPRQNLWLFCLYADLFK